MGTPLYEHLKLTVGFANPAIDRAFKKINRADFVQEDLKQVAYFDQPLSIGHGQTISQPTTVLMMLNWLDPQEGQKILDIGSGSGWTTALLASVAGKKGKVIGLERIPALVNFGLTNLQKYEFKNATILPANDKLGYSDEAPYDRILVSAAASELPNELIGQLKNRGILVIPVQSSIFRITKGPRGRVNREEFHGFTFVPLIR